jgi:ribosomal protein S18 acetylase RimI-like enzyme
MIVMEVRACDAHDLERLRQSWPTPGDVAGSHYAEQQDGHASFLVAWSNDEPLGYAVIQWGGCIGPNAKAAYPSAAEVTHLHVRPEHRSRGTGTALIGVAERTIADRAIAASAMSVNTENHDAVRLYERLGYQHTKITDVSEYAWVDDTGTTHHEREMNELLVKRL